MQIPLADYTIDKPEILEVLDSLLSKRISMGEKVELFERRWADYVGLNHVVACNSGSSAVLLAASALASHMHHEQRDIVVEVVIPALNWSTSIFPWIQLGFRPVFADVDEYLCLSPESVEQALSKHTRIVVAVPLLGSPFAPRLIEIAKSHGLQLVIDACEAHGARLMDKDVGSYGLLNCWSGFMSHHLQCGELGWIGTNDLDMTNTLRSLRAHGWVRERSDLSLIVQQVPDIDPRFLFWDIGYNLRPTELAAALALPQLDKLPHNIGHRRAVADALITGLEEWKEWLILPSQRPDSRHVYFGLSIIVRPEAPFRRKELTDYLNSQGIDTRPVMAGDIRRQPVFRRYKIDHRSVPTPMTDLVFESGFFIGCHTGIGGKEIDYIIDAFRTFGGRY